MLHFHVFQCALYFVLSTVFLRYRLETYTWQILQNLVKVCSTVNGQWRKGRKPSLSNNFFSSLGVYDYQTRGFLTWYEVEIKGHVSKKNEIYFKDHHHEYLFTSYELSITYLRNWWKYSLYRRWDYYVHSAVRKINRNIPRRPRQKSSDAGMWIKNMDYTKFLLMDLRSLLNKSWKVICLTTICFSTWLFVHPKAPLKLQERQQGTINIQICVKFWNRQTV